MRFSDYEGSASEAKDLAATPSGPLDNPRDELDLVRQATASGEYVPLEERIDNAYLELAGDDTEPDDEQWGDGEQFDEPVFEQPQPGTLLEQHRAELAGASPEQIEEYAASLPEQVRQQLVNEHAAEQADAARRQWLAESTAFMENRAAYQQERAATLAAQEQQQLEAGQQELARLIDVEKRKVGSSVATEKVAEGVEQAFEEAASEWRRQGIDEAAISAAIVEQAPAVIQAAVQYERTMKISHSILGRPPAGRDSWADLGDGRRVR